MILYEDKSRLQQCIDEVMTASSSSFYRDKYKHCFKNYTLEDIPFLTRDELVTVDPLDRLYVSQREVRFIGYTSGTTTGQPLISYFADVENYYFQPALGTPATKLLIVYPPLNKNFSASFVQQCRQAEKPVTPIFADFQNLANSAYIAARTKCDALYATPTIALQMADYLDTYYTTDVITLVAVSSELLTDAKRAELKRRYPNAVIANLYASSEIGQFLLYPCSHMLNHDEPKFHFLKDAVTALELIDGELVVSCDQNKAFPLLRYRTGDMFAVDEASCQCGIAEPVLKLMGRDGVDSVRVHGFEVKAGDVDAFFAAIPQTLDDYQLHFYPGKKQNSFSLVIEVVPEKTIDEPFFTSLIEDQFMCLFFFAHKKTAADVLESGLLEQCECRAVSAVSQQGAKRRVLVSHL